MNKIELYDGLGYCRYVSHHGSDLDIVRAARTSYDAEPRGEDKDKRLLAYLLRNRHTSPFEQANITFEIKMPIFVMRQFVRHRTFRLNEMSARYCEMPDEFYVPSEWRKQSKSSKQSSEPAKEINHELCTKMAEAVCAKAYEVYQAMIAEGVATEMARFVLPVNLMTKIMVNIDLHNLMHFLRLRLHPHAQKEIQVLAEAMCAPVEKNFPWTWEAFNRYKVNIVDLFDKS